MLKIVNDKLIQKHSEIPKLLENIALDEEKYHGFRGSNVDRLSSIRKRSLASSSVEDKELESELYIIIIFKLINKSFITGKINLY